MPAVLSRPWMPECPHHDLRIELARPARGNRHFNGRRVAAVAPQPSDCIDARCRDFGFCRHWCTPSSSRSTEGRLAGRAFQLFAHAGFFHQERFDRYCSDMHHGRFTRLQAHHSYFALCVQAELHPSLWYLNRRVPHRVLTTYNHFCAWLDTEHLFRDMLRAGRL